MLKNIDKAMWSEGPWVPYFLNGRSEMGYKKVAVLNLGSGLFNRCASDPSAVILVSLTFIATEEDMGRKIISVSGMIEIGGKAIQDVPLDEGVIGGPGGVKDDVKAIQKQAQNYLREWLADIRESIPGQRNGKAKKK